MDGRQQGKTIGKVTAWLSARFDEDDEHEAPDKVYLLVYLGTKESWGVARHTQDCETRFNLAVQQIELQRQTPEIKLHDRAQTREMEEIGADLPSLEESAEGGEIRRVLYGFPTRYITAAANQWRGFYFFAFAAPNCQALHDVNYRMNVQRIDSPWSAEFGLNQTGLNTLYVVFFPLYVILMAMHLYSVRRLTATRPIVHIVLKTFTMTLFIEFLSTVGHLIHYLAYTTDGVGAYTLSRTSTIVDVIARTLLLFLLLSIANGWAVLYLEVERFRTIFIITAVYCGLAIGHSVFDFASNTPLDLGPPNGASEFETVVAVLGIVMAVWFVASAIQTVRSTEIEGRRNFLIMIAAAYGLYFVSIPVVAILSAKLSPQLRNKAPVMFTQVVTFMGFAGMVSQFWYTRSPRIFLFDAIQVSDKEPDFQRL